MLDYLNENEIAGKIRNAVTAVIREGKVRTYDMLKMKGSQDVITRGAATTSQMTDEIISRLN